MDKSKLLFYDEYEDFYAMAEVSKAFGAYCRDAFGEDFSQDGFSNLEQIDMILPYIPEGKNLSILDIGCGNGKMLGYLQRKTGAYIYGFDYSEQAIRTARSLFTERAEFKEGIIGETDYPEEKFDVVISMDTMYFAQDMISFVGQIKGWLKKDGIFFVGYQEGDVLPKTSNAETTILANALRYNDMKYAVSDITKRTYDLLVAKRRAAIRHRAEFMAEGHEKWYELIMDQTEYISESYTQFQEKMARYVYVISK